MGYSSPTLWSCSFQWFISRKMGLPVMNKFKIHSEIVKTERSFFCFYDRMCKLNRRYTLEELRKKGAIFADSILLVKLNNAVRLFAFTTAKMSLPKIMVARKNGQTHMEMWLEYDGEGSPSEEFIIKDFPNEAEALLFYRKAASKNYSPAPPQKGWCSWYHYFDKIREKEILENLSFLKSHKKKIPLDIVQIDMGYCPYLGDWEESSERFPRGVKYLAKKIRDFGFIPGIWLAPFTAEEESMLFKTHPHWFYADDEYSWHSVFDSARWKALDISNPEALEFVVKTAQRFKEAGFDYYKLDFIDMAAIPGKRYSNNKSGVELYREGLGKIKKVIGSSPMLACNSIIPSSFGIADAVRINQDTAPFWEPEHAETAGAKEALKTAFTRLFLSGGPLQIDADCIVLRNWQSKLTEDEVKTYLSVVMVSSGAFFLSDKMELISEERLNYAFKKLPYENLIVVPEKIFDIDPPHSLILYSSDKIVGKFIINWEKREKFYSLGNLNTLNAVDFWSGEKIRGKKVEFYLGPHQSKLFFYS